MALNLEFENNSAPYLNADNLNNIVNEINDLENTITNKIKIDKIWEDSSVTTWNNATLGLDVNNYDFLLIVTSLQTSLVPAYFDLYLTWNGWYATVSNDVVTQRHIYRDGNDVHWGECWYRGINGHTGVGFADDIDYPKIIYGIKVN